MAFCGYLQANTAVDVLIGPFVDDTDGKTVEAGLTISQADVKLSKNGQALAQKNDDTAAAADSTTGYYNCELDATDTNTEGTLTLIVTESGALPVRHDFLVISQAAYASLVTAKDSGYMDVNVKAVSEDTTAADNLESACDNYSATRGLAGTALPAAAADAAGGLVISDAGGLDIDTKLAATNEVTAARMGALTDWIDGGRLDLIIDGILTDTGTTLQGELDGIQADTEDIQSRLPAALVSGRIDSSVGAMAANVLTEAAIADNAIAAEHLAANAIDAATFAADVDAEAAGWIWNRAMSNHVTVGTFGQRFAVAHLGTAQAGGNTSITLQASGPIATDNYYNENLIFLTGGTGIGQSNIITDYNGTSKEATVANTWAVNPGADTTYVILPSSTSPASVTGTVDANVTQIGGVAVSTTTAQLGVNVVNAAGTAWGSGAITAASIAADALGADEISAAAVTKIQAGLATPTNITAGTITTVTNLTNAPTTGDFTATMKSSITAAVPTAAANADAVWDEASTGHTDAGKAGEQLWTDVDAILTDTATIDTAGEIAAAVWSADATTYQTQGTFGQAIGDPAADTNSIFKAVVTDATGATVGVDAAAILADTNELQTDWVDGGRLDLLLDAKPILTTVIESQGSVTLQQVLQALLAACAGVTDDSDTSTMLLKTPNGGATRITATLDGTDRTAISLSFS